MASLRNTSFPEPTGAGIVNLRPSLRMSDGGMFSALKSAIGLKQDSPELAAYKARSAAEREAAKNPPKPAPAAPAAPLGPMGTQSVIDTRMKAAGAKNGGELRMPEGVGGVVPGEGSGDKIPAKYEPGEFVVSNDMLDAAPSLRDELHSLRTQVLAKKGMTPAQADAKAVGDELNAEVGGRYKLDAFGNPMGVNDEQNNQGMAGVQPANQGANNLSGRVRPAVGGAGNRSGELAPAGRLSYSENLKKSLPGTSAVVQGTMDDVSRDLQVGNYPRAVMKGLRGSATLIPATLDDTAGAGVRGAYDMLRNPFEDAGRVLLNMPDRPESTALRQPAAATPYTPSPAAFNPAARVLRQGGTPALPAGPASPFGTKTPANLQDYSQVDQNAEAMRVAQGREAFGRDKALADGMEAERLAKERAGFESQAATLRVGQEQSNRLDLERARKNAETSASSMINDGARRTGRTTLAKLDALELEGTKQTGETLRNAATNATSRSNAQTQADSYRYTADSNLRGDIYKTDGAARSARATALRDGAFKEREFQAGRADKAFEQGRKAEEDTVKYAQQMFTKSGRDGKPVVDEASANDYIMHLRQTAAAIANDPNTPPEVRQKFASGDLSAFDNADRAAMLNLYRIKQAQMADRRSITNPLGSTGDSSFDLRKYKPTGDASNLLQRRVRNEMGEVPDTTLQYGGDANHIFWNSGPADTSLLPPKRLRD